MDVSERLALLSNDLQTLFGHNDPVWLRIHAVCADAKAEIERLRAHEHAKRQIIDQLDSQLADAKTDNVKSQREVERLRVEIVEARNVARELLECVEEGTMGDEILDENPWLEEKTEEA